MGVQKKKKQTRSAAAAGKTADGSSEHQPGLCAPSRLFFFFFLPSAGWPAASRHDGARQPCHHAACGDARGGRAGAGVLCAGRRRGVGRCAGTSARCCRCCGGHTGTSARCAIATLFRASAIATLFRPLTSRTDRVARHRRRGRTAAVAQHAITIIVRPGRHVVAFHTLPPFIHLVRVLHPCSQRHGRHRGRRTAARVWPPDRRRAARPVWRRPALHSRHADVPAGWIHACAFNRGGAA